MLLRKLLFKLLVAFLLPDTFSLAQNRVWAVLQLARQRVCTDTGQGWRPLGRVLTEEPTVEVGRLAEVQGTCGTQPVVQSSSTSGVYTTDLA